MAKDILTQVQSPQSHLADKCCVRPGKDIGVRCTFKQVVEAKAHASLPAITPSSAGAVPTPGGGPRPIIPTGCQHWWVIEEAHGPVSRGVCRYCGQPKEFHNSFMA